MKTVQTLLVVPLLLTFVNVVGAQENPPVNAEAIVSATSRTLHAIGTGDTGKLSRLIGDLAERDRAMFESISAWSFHIRVAQIDGNTAHVRFEWFASFDHEQFASRILPDLRAGWEGSGKNAEEEEQKTNAWLLRLRKTIEAPEQVLVLRRSMANEWTPTNRIFMNSCDFDGNAMELPHARELVKHAESTCGAATPEDAARRTIGSWKAHNVVRAILMSQPGEPRMWYAQSDKSMLHAIAIRQFQVGRVWIRGDLAWVEYTWTARFNDDGYARLLWDEAMNAAEPPNTPQAKRATMARILQTANLLKQTVEAERHFIRLKRHGNRWYNAGDPMGTREPPFPATRDASR